MRENDRLIDNMNNQVDRLTLGVQTVFNQVNESLSVRYQNAVRERMHRVDPSQQVRCTIMTYLHPNRYIIRNYS